MELGKWQHLGVLNKSKIHPIDRTFLSYEQSEIQKIFAHGEDIYSECFSTPLREWLTSKTKQLDRGACAVLLVCTSNSLLPHFPKIEEFSCL